MFRLLFDIVKRLIDELISFPLLHRRVAVLFKPILVLQKDILMGFLSVLLGTLSLNKDVNFVLFIEHLIILYKNEMVGK